MIATINAELRSVSSSPAKNGVLFLDLHPFSAYRHTIAMFGRRDDDLSSPQVPTAIAYKPERQIVENKEIMGLYTKAAKLNAVLPSPEWLFVNSIAADSDLCVLADFVLPFEFEDMDNALKFVDDCQHSELFGYRFSIGEGAYSAARMIKKAVAQGANIIPRMTRTTRKCG